MVFLEQMIVLHLVKKFTVMEPEGHLSNYQLTHHWTLSRVSSLFNSHPHNLFL